MIKLILSDMDGTLLTPEGNLPEGFAEMMEKLREKKVLFVPASGRQYYSLIKTFEKYKDNMLFLSDNGNIIMDGKGKNIYCNEMPVDAVKRVIKEAHKIGRKYVILAGCKSVYLTHDLDDNMADCLKYFTEYKFLDDIYDFEKTGDKIVKVCIVDVEYKAEKNIYNPIVKVLENDFQVVLSDSFGVDIMNIGAGKGKGIEILQKQLNIQKNECAAFGDYLNDYTMMQAVHYSFAMENAHPNLKEIANYRAKSNAEYGVVLKINELMDKGLI